MTSFSDGFWNLFIIVTTFGGIFALYLLTRMNSSAGVEEAGDKVETMGHVWDGDLEELNNPLPRWWVNLFYVTIAFGIVYLMVYPGLGSNTMAFGWTQIKQYEAEMAEAEARYGPIFEQHAKTPIPAIAADPAALRIGERLYASYCTACHGLDAGGVPGFPNLRDNDWQWGGEPAQIEATILDGRDGAMPGWNAALGEAGTRDMVRYVLSLSGGDATGLDGAKTQFAQFCAACHGPDGKGNPMFGAPNLTDDVWLYGNSEDALTVTIANGRMGKMPAHREFLGEAKVHLLSAYVWSLSNGDN